MKTALLIAAVSCFSGCLAPDTLPACDSLRVVRFVSLCEDGRARCALLSTAPAGAMASGCSLTVVAVPGGPRQVECVEICE